MKRFITTATVIVTAFLLIIVSCDTTPTSPEHDNPFDPDNPGTGGNALNLTVTFQDDFIELEWDDIPFSKKTGYRIFRSRNENVLSDAYVEIASVEEPPYSDHNIEDGSLYAYKVLIETDGASQDINDVVPVIVYTDPVLTIDEGNISHTDYVNLTINAFGADSARISNSDDLSTVEWQAYTDEKEWLLDTTSYGNKTVYMQLFFNSFSVDTLTFPEITSRIITQTIIFDPYIRINELPETISLIEDTPDTLILDDYFSDRFGRDIHYSVTPDEHLNASLDPDNGLIIVPDLNFNGIAQLELSVTNIEQSRLLSVNEKTGLSEGSGGKRRIQLTRCVKSQDVRTPERDADTTITLTVAVEPVNDRPVIHWQEEDSTDFTIPADLREVRDDVEFIFTVTDIEDDLASQEFRWEFIENGGIEQIESLLTIYRHDSVKIAWRPPNEFAGNYSPVLAVFDSDSDSAIVKFDLRVTDPPPEVTGTIPDTMYFNEDEEPRTIADLDTVFTDFDGDDVSYEINAESDGLIIDLVSGHKLRLQPEADFDSLTTITITASDEDRNEMIGSEGLSGRRFLRYTSPNSTSNRDSDTELSFTVEVRPENDAPFFITANGDTAGTDDAVDAFEGDTCEYYLYVRDVDNPQRSFVWTPYVTGIPEENWQFEPIDDTTYSFHWMVSNTAAGQGDYIISFTVEDDNNARDSLAVTFSLTNPGPQLEGNGIESFETDEDADPIIIADLDTVFIDPDRDPLRFLHAEDTLQQYLPIDIDNVLTFIPPLNFFGEIFVEIISDDDPGSRIMYLNAQFLFDSQGRKNSVTSSSIQNNFKSNREIPGRDDQVRDDFTITVNPVNDEPIWEEPDPDSTIVGAEAGEIRFVVQVNDIEHDDLTIEVNDWGAASDTTFVDNNDGSGEFFWIPSYDDAGEYEIEFTITDNGVSGGNQEDDPKSISNIITVHVDNRNREPVWDEPDTVNVIDGTEREELEFTIETHDDDGDEIKIEVISWGGIPDDAFTDNSDGTGEFSWIPGWSDAGEYEITFLVSDEGEPEPDSIVVCLSINIANNNRPPEVQNEIPDIEIDEDEIGERTAIADLDTVIGDPDIEIDDSLCFAIISPDVDVRDRIGLELDNENNVLSYLPDENYNYPDGIQISLTATDIWDAQVETDFSLFINSINDPPQIVIPEAGELDTTIIELDTLRISFAAEDADHRGDQLEWNVSEENLPDGYFLDDNGDGTAVFTWNPEEGDAREEPYSITIEVTDGEDYDRITLNIEVTPYNHPPGWEEFPGDTDISEADTIEITLNATDGDDDSLFFSYTSDIPGGEDDFINDNLDGTATFTWIPSYDIATLIRNSEQFTVRFAVTDRIDTTYNDLIITVNNSNRSPGWSEDIPGDLSVLETYWIDTTFTGTDPDEDELTCTLIYDNIPENDEFEFIDNEDGSCRFRWRTLWDDAGEYLLRIRITDGDLDDTAEVVLTVRDRNRPPVWDTPDPDSEIKGHEQREIGFTASASDPDEDNRLTITISDTAGLPVGFEFTDNGDGTADFIWTPEEGEAGTYQPTFTISDGTTEIEEQLTIIVRSWEFTETDISHNVLILEATINNEPLAEGDIIGVFTPGGICAGTVIIGAEGFPDEGISLAAWGDDTTTVDVIEGFSVTEEEEMTVRIWDEDGNREYSVDISEMIRGRMIFEDGGLTIIRVEARDE